MYILIKILPFFSLVYQKIVKSKLVLDMLTKPVCSVLGTTDETTTHLSIVIFHIMRAKTYTLGIILDYLD